MLHPPETDSKTRQKLLLTALRLFAQQGLDAVSMRTINTASGTKNSGAVHYYFGNKQGVIAAIVAFITAMTDEHLTAVNLAAVKEAVANHQVTLREVLRESFLPTFMLPDNYPWGQSAIKFLSRLMLEEDPKILDILNKHSEKGLSQLLEILTVALPTIPENILKLRLMFSMNNLVHGTAEVKTLKNTPLGDLSFHGADLLEHILDYLEAGLAAPVHRSG